MIEVHNNARLKRFIAFAEANGLGGATPGSYQEAVSLCRTAEWWRNCAVHLFETFEDQLTDSPGCLTDTEVEAAEACDEHHDRCGDS
jgi:hypothetical protein